MTKQVYRTAQGKSIDMGSLILKNENVRAVGNMNVNARGDLLDDNNKIVTSRTNQINQQLNKTVTKQPAKK